MAVNLKDYSEILRGLIEDPAYRMLLKAHDFGMQVESMPPGESMGVAAFQLISGAFAPEFVTLWELFEHRQEFNTFIEMFAAKACEIHEKQPYAAIVTATATSRHILDHAHAAIEAKRDNVSVFYLGDYPFLDPENRDLLDFKGENVLIVTDVVATGSLVAKMADITKEVGGNPIAVLCAVLVGPHLISAPELTYGRRSTGDWEQKYGTQSGVEERREKLRIHSLTQRPVPFLIENGCGSSPKIIKIDPVTMLPVDDLFLPNNGLYPHFTQEEMFWHFESAEAIDFDFYNGETSQLTTAIRFKNLLATHRGALWGAIKELVRDGQTLVTTFRWDDVRFKEFVEDNLESDSLPFVFVPKRSSLATSSSYFLLSSQLDKIQEKKIVLLLAEIHTSERLRNLVSLLVSNGAKSIKVICILNRMGIHTSSFISRLERLVRGVGRAADQAEEHTGFEFFFLYSLPDINGDDLRRMRETIRALFDYYTANTRVSSFRRSMQQEIKYFRAKSRTSHRFELAKSQSLHAPFVLTNGGGKLAKKIAVNSKEGMLALLCSNLVATRDFRPFIQVIRDGAIRDKETLYKIFGILLTDLSYLKMTGSFTELRDTLIDEIRIIRKQRLELEPQNPSEAGNPSDIAAAIDLETHLLVGLSLFSYLDHDLDYDGIILEMMSSGLVPAEWVRFPVNFTQYFGNERLAWCISMLCHFSRHGFRQSKVAIKLKQGLQKLADGLLDQLGTILPSDEDGASHQRVKASLNLVLTEVGVHELTEKHQVIRYLQSKIVAIKRSHSPIDSSLHSARLELEKSLLFADDHPEMDLQSGNRRILVNLDSTKKALEDAIFTVGVLEEIAEAVRQMLVFTPASRDRGSRYSSETSAESLVSDVGRMGDIFQRIRISNQFSKSDLIKLTELRTRIAYDLWDENSYLRELLVRYMVPLGEWVEAALKHANDRLRADGYGDVWEATKLEVRKWPSDWKVLVEPQLLREVLRNVFSNVRHAFGGYKPPGSESFASLVKLEVQRINLRVEGSRAEGPNYFRLTVTSRGFDFQEARENATFRLHQHEIEGFLGQLQIEALPGKKGAVVTLTLLSRNDPPSIAVIQPKETKE